MKECDLLFISSPERGHLAQTLKQLQKGALLTVSDQEGFCQAGGMINLVQAREKLSFEVNNGAARCAGLRISSHLLKLAQNVID